MQSAGIPLIGPTLGQCVNITYMPLLHDFHGHTQGYACQVFPHLTYLVVNFHIRYASMSELTCTLNTSTKAKL